MTAKVNDYKKAILALKDSALQSGQDTITVKAGDLHKKVNKGTSPSFVACCSAMRQNLLEGDEVLVEGKTKNGVSSSLTIQYNLKEVDQRKTVYTRKQRVRAKQSEKEVKKINKVSMTALTQQWLAELGLKYSIQNDVYHVDGLNGRWNIYLGYDKQGRHQSFNEKLFHVIKNIDDETEKFSLVVEDTPNNKKAWFEISDTLKCKLNLSIIFISKNKMKEVI